MGNPIADPARGLRGGQMRPAAAMPFGGNAFDLHLGRPVRAGSRIRGSVRIALASGVQVVEIDDIAKANNLERVIDGRRFVLNAMNPDPDEWFLTIITYNAGPDAMGLNKTRNRAARRQGQRAHARRPRHARRQRQPHRVQHRLQARPRRRPAGKAEADVLRRTRASWTSRSSFGPKQPQLPPVEADDGRPAFPGVRRSVCGRVTLNPPGRTDADGTRRG